jgi:anti-sigma factor RsiW
MTDCLNGDVRDALPDYLNDRLDAERRRAVEAHLSECAACREELSLLRGLRATMHRAPDVDVARISAAIAPYRVPARRGPATNWRVAAAIAALAVGGTSVALLRGRAPVSRSAAVAVTVAPAPNGDSSPVVPPAAAPQARAGERPTPGGTSVASTSARELAIAGGSIGDLSDGELSALVEGIESLDGVPSAEVETPAPVSMSAQEGL